MSEKSDIRVRFAPSPTGYLHVGGARTALFNWLLARHHDGVFVLRIEDTDRERSSDAMTAAILEGMEWLGLDWDEGPFHQADGVERHRADALRLLTGGAAYRCFCTAEELESRRAAHGAGADAFRYDRHCESVASSDAERRAGAGEPHTVRFRVPAGTTSWEDAVHGTIAFDNADIEDFIILRTDGTPIYNMAVVSDDVAMRITHVVRGDDHISNTPKQIMLYRALGVPEPVFAHVPMILGPDGKRLSKRHGATAVGEYHNHGILPDALFNFLALLGWSPGTDEEIFARDELIRRFSLDGINRKSAIFDTQKLEWMNGRYLAEMPGRDLGAVLSAALGAEPDTHTEQWWTELAELLKVRSRTVLEMIEQARPYAFDDLEYDPAAVAKHWKDGAAVASRMEKLSADFSSLPEWTEPAVEACLRSRADAEGVGAGKLIHPLRVALTGAGASPGIFEVARLLGRERVLARMERAVSALATGASQPGG
ncbi:MAG TPA: glutamate--tRNA ligase [Longimicrobiales bacterium]|nr:glutamate--tRNA ligase [Longimicrobiales bacterium]